MEQLTSFFTVLSFNQWLLIALAAVMVISLISINRQRKIQQQQSLTMQMLQRDLRALANAAVGVGGRVLEIERQQRKRPQVIQVQEPVKTSAPATSIEYITPGNQPYEKAIRMVQSGATVKDIVNVCGLSKSEAELVTMMHRLDKAS